MTTKEYLVEWIIEVDADTPEDAAQIALNIQRDLNSIATTFKVYAPGEDNPIQISIAPDGEITHG